MKLTQTRDGHFVRLSGVGCQTRIGAVNGGPGNIRFSPLTQINRENVKQLAVAWTYESGRRISGSEMQSNPIIVDGMLYATTPKMRVIALDANTGREIWSFNPSEPTDPKRRYRHRGVTVYTQSRILHLSKLSLGFKAKQRQADDKFRQEWADRFA